MPLDWPLLGTPLRDAELEALGWDELVATAPVLLVEWPERAAHTLPTDTIGITLSHADQIASFETSRPSWLSK